MKELQAKMLDVLDRMPAAPGFWRAASITLLREIIASNLNATPVELRRAIRRRLPLDNPQDRVFREVVNLTINEATGLSGLRRARDQDAGAVLFNASSNPKSSADTDTSVANRDTSVTRPLIPAPDVAS